MSHAGSVTVLGSINVDIAAYASALPQPGQTVHGERYTIGLGGKGCNQAVAAAQLGAPTRLIGRVGADDFGAVARSAIEGFGLDTASVLDDPDNATGVAIIGIDGAGQNMITVIGGANMALDASDIERARGVLTETAVLLLQLETPLATSLMAADIVRAAGGRVVLDPAPAPADGLEPAILRRVDVITPNEAETEALTGIRPTDAATAATAAARLIERGITGAVVKLGAAGVFHKAADAEGFVPPYPVKTVDSVAAGDCFNGGLATALAQGASLAESVRFAAACGALSTTRYGAADSAPDRAAVEALIGAAG